MIRSVHLQINSILSNKIILKLKQTMSTSVEPQPTQSQSKSDHDRSRCLFCRICDENEKESSTKTIIYKDEDIVVFPDIRPVSKYHFLVVPKKHIRDSKSLNGSQAHVDLLNRLVEVGMRVLNDKATENSNMKESSVSNSNVKENNVSSSETESSSNPDVPAKVLMGFHWPPFHTISHLHLHVISPSDSIGFIGRLIFRPNSYWFVSPEWVKDRLEKLKLEGTS